MARFLTALAAALVLVCADASAAKTYTDCRSGATIDAKDNVSVGECVVFGFTDDADDQAFQCFAPVCVFSFDPDSTTDGAVSGRTVDLRGPCVNVTNASEANANRCPATGSALTGAGGSADSQLAHRSVRGGTAGDWYFLDVTGQGAVSVKGQ